MKLVMAATMIDGDCGFVHRSGLKLLFTLDARVYQQDFPEIPLL
jgi:hypothetical protein